MNKLLENPNVIYDPKTDQFYEYDSSPASPFSYYHDAMYVGEIGDFHGRMQPPNGYFGDDRGEYSGRIFYELKIISFWHFPENKEKLKKVLSDLQSAVNDTDDSDSFAEHTISEYTPINLFDDEWRIEIPDEDFEKLKQYPEKAKNRYNDGSDEAPIAGEHWPEWGSWDHKKISSYTTVANYNGNYERAPEELAQEHLKSPMKKKQKPVTPGFGSKHPEAEKKAKEKMNAPFESFYPRLNESPDTIILDDETKVTYKDNKAIPFCGMMKRSSDIISDVWIGNYGQMHDYSYSPVYNYDYPGRLFTAQKILTMWAYPSKKELTVMIEALEDQLGIRILDNGWQIEVNSWYHDFEPIDDYVEHDVQAVAPSEEEYQQHILSPLLKGEKPVTPGFGSKHPKAEDRFKHELEKSFESVQSTYPPMNENPDAAHYNSFDSDNYYETVSFNRSEALPFGYRDGKLILGFPGGMHGTANIDRYRGLPGRIWTLTKVISFWIYPTRKEYRKVISDLEKALQERFRDPDYKIWDDPDYKIEILRDLEPTEFHEGKYKERKWADHPSYVSANAQDDPYGDWQFRSRIWDVIPVKQYVGSEQPTEEDLKKEHELSPLLKKGKPVTTGYGSKHPEAEQKFKQKMKAPFENLEEPEYPRLFENPEVVKLKDGTKINWSSEDGYPFGFKRNIGSANGEEEFRVGEVHGVHYKLFTNLYRQDLKYPGRVWPREKIITFWTFPETKEELVGILKNIEAHFRMKIVGDPEWQIEVLPPRAPDEWEDDIFREEELVSLNDYVGSGSRSEKELNQEHVLSPLLKKSKDIPKGFGSKHPEAEKQFKNKMNKPFENKTEDMKDFYPRLNEDKNPPKPPIKTLYEAGGMPTIREALLRLGYAVNSTETTAGAKKYWLIKKESVGPKTWEQLKNDLEANGVKSHFYPGDDVFTTMGPELSGNGWKLEQQGGRGADLQNLFLAVYKNRPRGEEYYYGADV